MIESMFITLYGLALLVFGFWLRGLWDRLQTIDDLVILTRKMDRW